MQTEAEANAIAWGLSDFNKSMIKIFKSKDNILWRQDQEDESKGESSSQSTEPPLLPILQECQPNIPTIFARGTCFEIGVEVTPPSNWKRPLEEFIRSWETQSQYLSLDLLIKCDEKIIPRETSYVQKLTQTRATTAATRTTQGGLLLDQKIIKRTKTGLFIGTITSLRVPAQYLDVSLSLVLQLSIVVPSSQMPSNYRHGMSPEEKEVRALLETGRYHPPYIAPREVPIPIRIIESLSIQCWSRNLDSWTSVNSVEMRNMHPLRDILIRHVGINLNASLRTEAIKRSYDSGPLGGMTNSLHPPLQCTSTNKTINENIGATSVLLLPCSQPLEPWFNVVDLSQNPHDTTEIIRIKRGESHTLVYHISPRHVVNDSTTSSSTSGIPPSVLSGHFLTPVDVWWIECPENVLSSSDASSSMTRSSSPSSLPSGCLSSYSEEDCIINTASLCWGIEKITGREFAVEIDGPSSILSLHPVELKLRISNLTSERRSINLFLQQPKEAHLFDSPPPPLSTSVSEGYDTQQQDQWRSSGIVNHHITLPIRYPPSLLLHQLTSARNLDSGKAATVSVYLFPLRQGIVEFSDLHVVDEATKSVLLLPLFPFLL
jgi:hypothetical protein